MEVLTTLQSYSSNLHWFGNTLSMQAQFGAHIYTKIWNMLKNFPYKWQPRNWDAKYLDLLTETNITSLEARRRSASLCLLYKIVNCMCYFPSPEGAEHLETLTISNLSTKTNASYAYQTKKKLQNLPIYGMLSAHSF